MKNGIFNQAIGKAKSAVGKATRSRRMQAKGKVQAAVGKGQSKMAKASRKVRAQA